MSNTEETQPFKPLFRQEEDDTETTLPNLPPVPPESPHTPPEDSIPTNVVPVPAPPPTLVRPRPVAADVPHTVDPAHDRGRAGVFALVLAGIILGAILGWIFGGYSAAKEVANIPATVETSVSVQRSTATATATAVKTKTKVDTRTVTAPPPAPKTVTATKTVKVPAPAPPARTVTQESVRTPTSCLYALDAANELADALRGNPRKRDDQLIDAIKADFNRYAEECRNDQ